MVTHLIKFGVGLVLLLGAFLRCIIGLQNENAEEISTTTNPSALFWWWSPLLLLLLLLAMMIPTWVYWYYHETLYAIGKPWMDPKIPATANRMEMHVPLRLFESTETARRAACLPQLVASSRHDDEKVVLTPNVLLLDTMDWQFQLFHSVEDALTLVYEDTNTNEQNTNQDGCWSPIQVPGHWMLQGFDDNPIYTNQKYPFPCKPPVVPRRNPTGVYKLSIILPSDYISEDDDDGHQQQQQQVSIMLHGVESACFVFWNGQLLGFFKDSRLPSEFAIPSEFLVGDTPGSAVLHLVVVRWSDGSYVEDQDHWWMAGIHRSVELIRRSPKADIMDYHVAAAASGDLTVSVQLRESALLQPPKEERRVVTARLYSDEQVTADGADWKEAKRELWSQRQTVDPTSATTTLTFQGQLEDIQPWTAETPHLYTLVLEQTTDDGTTRATHQVESCRVGFRSIDVDGGILHVNGKRITICGINRHEHDPDHGKVVSLERMMQDITTLKYV
jgi:beta-galactosidase